MSPTTTVCLRRRSSRIVARALSQTRSAGTAPARSTAHMSSAESCRRMVGVASIGSRVGRLRRRRMADGHANQCRHTWVDLCLLNFPDFAASLQRRWSNPFSTVQGLERDRRPPHCRIGPCSALHARVAVEDDVCRLARSGRQAALLAAGFCNARVQHRNHAQYCFASPSSMTAQK